MNQVNFRVTAAELLHLKKYCDLKERQQSEVLRELIRRLEVSGALEPIG